MGSLILPRPKEKASRHWIAGLKPLIGRFLFRHVTGHHAEPQMRGGGLLLDFPKNRLKL